jgi:subtilase family serine protease
VDLNASLHVSLVLSRDPALQAAFEQLLSAQQDSASPLYHRWLSPAQVGELFGVTDHDLQVVKDWAASQGLRVDSVAPSRTILELSGTAASVGNAFRVSFAYYTVGDGQHLAATVEPSVPAALAPLTATVQGLVEMPLSPEVHAVPLAMPARGPAGSGGLAGTESARPHLT